MKTKLLTVLVLSIALSGCFPTLGTSSSSSKSSYVKGAYAAGFPPIPLYKNSKVLESYGYKGEFGSASVTGDDVSKVVQFYQASLKPLGWDYNLVQKSSSNWEFDINNAGQQGSIIVNTTADGKKTGISVSIAPR